MNYDTKSILKRNTYMCNDAYLILDHTLDVNNLWLEI